MLIISLINLFTVCNLVVTCVISIIMLSLWVADMYNLLPKTIRLKLEGKPKGKYDDWEIEFDVKLNKYFVRNKVKDKVRGYIYIQYRTNLGRCQLHDKRRGYGVDSYREALELLDDYLYLFVEDIRVYPIKPKLDDNLS